MKAITLSSLRADLSAVESLLHGKSQQSDPIGWFQLKKRKEHLLSLTQTLETQNHTRASVALYFGGLPVIGSKGISASFAGKALDIYQDLIAKRLARKERGEDLSERGRVPGRTNAALIVTEVARGSFGFVLEEPESNGEIIDTALKETVSEISELIYAISTKESHDIETEAEILDNRLLLSVRNFFRLLDDSGATMRISTEIKQISLSRDQIEIGRNRIDTLEWHERIKKISGVLYIVPESRRFDLEPLDGSPTIRGKITKQCIDTLRENNDYLLRQVIGQQVSIHLIEKEVRSGLDEQKLSYSLTSVDLPSIAS